MKNIILINIYTCSFNYFNILDLLVSKNLKFAFHIHSLTLKLQSLALFLLLSIFYYSSTLFSNNFQKSLARGNSTQLSFIFQLESKRKMFENFKIHNFKNCIDSNFISQVMLSANKIYLNSTVAKSLYMKILYKLERRNFLCVGYHKNNLLDNDKNLF